MAETAERLRPADVLVANAGTGPRANLADVDVPARDHAMNINLRASFFLAQAMSSRARRQIRERAYRLRHPPADPVPIYTAASRPKPQQEQGPEIFARVTRHLTNLASARRAVSGPD